MLKNYLKVGLRNLLKNRIYSFINITGLALGMACCILILLWVQDELSFDSFHKNNDRLYKVVNQLDDGWMTASPWSLVPTLKKDFPEVDKATRYNTMDMLVKYNDKSFYENIGFVDPDFLEMFTFPLTEGDPSSALNQKESIIISEEAAKKYFKNEDPVGKILQINNDKNYKITGVMKNIPSNSSLQFDMLAPIDYFGKDLLSTWYWETTGFVLLKKNVNVGAFRNKIAGTTKKYDKRVENKNLINNLQKFSESHLHFPGTTGPILYIYLFSAIAIIVLFVACINFINLITARASVRGKEIGMRKVVGASKSHIVWQFYAETFLLSIIAYGLAIFITELFLPAFNLLAEKNLSLKFFHNPILLFGSLGIILLTTLLAGSYPALLLSNFRPIRVLKQSNPAGFRRASLRWILVVVQFCVSIILIVMTITISMQINYIQNKNLGFNRDQVIILQINDGFRNKYESVKNQLLQYPDITHVTEATCRPDRIYNVNPVYWEGKSSDQFQYMNYVTIDYDYLKTFEMKLVDGRNFSKKFPSDAKNYIVNEAAVKFMKMKSPVGKLFSIWKNEGKIIGVVRDFNSRNLHSEIEPIVMTLTQYVPYNQVFIKVKPENIKTTLENIKKVWKEFLPAYPFQYEFYDDAFLQQYMNEQKIKQLFQYFSALAIFISCIGLFGLSAFTAQRRTKEIGIRKVAGASVFNIYSLILKDFIKWLLIAAVIAVPVTYYVINKWLADFAYHIDITWTIFAEAIIFIMLIAVLSISWQVIYAAKSNPAKSLRYE